MPTRAVSPFSRAALGVALATALLLLVPAVAMQFDSGVAWSTMDFIVAGALFFAAGMALVLLLRHGRRLAWRAASLLAVGATLFLIWANLAVGILGDEGNPANRLYFVIPLIGIVGAALARLRAHGMAWVLLAMAAVQAAIAATALLAGLGGPGASTAEILAVNGFFVVLFVIAAGLFHHATRGAA